MMKRVSYAWREISAKKKRVCLQPILTLWCETILHMNVNGWNVRKGIGVCGKKVVVQEIISQ